MKQLLLDVLGGFGWLAYFLFMGVVAYMWFTQLEKWGVDLNRSAVWMVGIIVLTLSLAGVVTNYFK